MACALYLPLIMPWEALSWDTMSHQVSIGSKLLLALAGLWVGLRDTALQLWNPPAKLAHGYTQGVLCTAGSAKDPACEVDLAPAPASLLLPHNQL